MPPQLPLLSDHEVRGWIEREIPEALKPRQIEIKTHPVKALTNKAKKMIGADNKAA